jgi:hypothetical protein
VTAAQPTEQQATNEARPRYHLLAKQKGLPLAHPSTVAAFHPSSFETRCLGVLGSVGVRYGMVARP